MFTIDPQPLPKLRPTFPDWHRVTFDAPKITGQARIIVSADESEVRVTLDLSPTLDDENGSTLYRDADPDADEIQTGHAVIRHPVRVNGVAYRGTVYAERSLTGAWPGWRASTRHVGRPDIISYTSDGMTEAAAALMRDVTKQLADQFATLERIHLARLATAQANVDRADQAVREALAEAEAAREALRTLNAALHAEWEAAQSEVMPAS